MEYPNELPQDSQARVDAARAKAERDFVKAEQGLESSFFRSKYQRAVDQLLKEYIASIFFVFADEALKISKSGLWPASQIQSKVEEFGRSVIWVAERKCRDRNGLRFERVNSWDFNAEMWQEIAISERWLAFLEQAAEMAETQAAAPPNHAIPEEVNDTRAAKVATKVVYLTRAVNVISLTSTAEPSKSREHHESTETDLEVAEKPTGIVEPKPRRGPKPNMKFHHQVADVVNSFGFGGNWKEASNLEKIVEKMEKQHIPPSQAWLKRHPPVRSWTRALEFHPDVVRKTLEYSLEMAAKDNPEKLSETLANLR